MNNQTGYLCSCCGQYHTEIPMSYGNEAPYYFYAMDEEERDERIEMNSDLCIMDEEYFFIRGCIEIPVKGKTEPFVWDAWVSLSEANMDKTIELWEEEGREEQLSPMFGWLSTSIPCYPETLNLKTMVHTRSVGIRPLIKLEPTDHPLAVEQREGITMDRVKEIAEELCSENV